MIKLNTTGSYYRQDGHYWSYDTKLTDSYKGYKVFNATYYSSTTCKHQSYTRQEYNYDIELHNCSYGNWDVKDCIEKEIQDLEWQLKQRQEQKRNTQKKQDDIKNLKEQIEFLSNLIKDDVEEQEQTDVFEEFQELWSQLSEKNKEHVRNGMGDNLIHTEEQAKTLNAIIKSMLLFQNFGG